MPCKVVHFAWNRKNGSGTVRLMSDVGGIGLGKLERSEGRPMTAYLMVGEYPG